MKKQIFSFLMVGLLIGSAPAHAVSVKRAMMCSIPPLQKKNKCTPAETALGRKWLIGIGATVAALALAAFGKFTHNEIRKYQQEALKDSNKTAGTVAAPLALKEAGEGNGETTGTVAVPLAPSQEKTVERLPERAEGLAGRKRKAPEAPSEIEQASSETAGTVAAPLAPNQAKTLERLPERAKGPAGRKLPTRKERKAPETPSEMGQE